MSRTDTCCEIGTNEPRASWVFRADAATDAPGITENAVRCGWTFGGYVSRLLDPAPCPGASADLGYWLNTTSTSTVRLANGTWRMYIQKPRLMGYQQEFGVSRDLGPPHRDALGELKYAISGYHDQNLAAIDQWFRADENVLPVEDLHFCRNRIAFIDSPSGENFDLYMPIVIPPDLSDPCRFETTDSGDPSSIWSIPGTDVFLLHNDKVRIHFYSSVFDGLVFATADAEDVCLDCTDICVPRGFQGSVVADGVVVAQLTGALACSSFCGPVSMYTTAAPPLPP